MPADWKTEVKEYICRKTQCQNTRRYTENMKE